MTDEQLRAAYGRAMPAPRSADRAGCASPDEMIALLRKEGSELARLATLDHTMTCSACQRDFELLRSIDAAGRREDAAARSAGWRKPLGLALAASLLLAIGLGPGRDWLARQEPDVMRGGAASIVVASPAEGATVTTDSLEFAWHPVAGASRYTFELLTPDGTVRIGETTADTALTLRGLRDVPAGDYRWWVRAEMPGGERRSETRSIRLGP